MTARVECRREKGRCREKETTLCIYSSSSETVEPEEESEKEVESSSSSSSSTVDAAFVAITSETSASPTVYVANLSSSGRKSLCRRPRGLPVKTVTRRRLLTRGQWQ